MVTISDIKKSYDRISGFIVNTPIITSNRLNELFSANLFFKDETKQLTGSFKIRGALSAISKLADKNIEGVIAYSSGNHAQGVSKAAQLFKMKSIIVMPDDAPKTKLENTKNNGGEIVLYKRHVQSREEIAQKISIDTGLPLIKPFDNKDVIAGQGTFGLEVCNYFLDNNKSLDVVLSCTSGGGLVAGTSIAVKHFFHSASIFPVEPENCNDTQISLEKRTRTRKRIQKRTICDALEVEIPGEITFPINLVNCNEGLIVNDLEVIKAMKILYEEFNIIAEPSGCVAFASILNGSIKTNGKNILVTISGGNIDSEKFNFYINQ